MMARRALLVALACASLGAYAEPARAQIRWRDLVLTMGVAGEGYRGNLSVVTIPVVDSTNSASAAVGEIGLRGAVSLFSDNRRQLDLTFDGGLRQFAAFGFKVQDYAPREWVGATTLDYQQAVRDRGFLRLSADARGRSVRDRTPIPLYLQPGYGSYAGAASFRLDLVESLSLDARARLERADYSAPDYAPQLDLLDWSAGSVELGAEWGQASSLRVFGAYRRTEYAHQGSFDPDDPYRRDHAFQAGLLWSVRSSLFAQIGVEGVLNRSNSNRPEYNAVSLRTVMSYPLPWDLMANLFAVLTAKSYLHETEYARLVPGEEADNASVVYLSVSRPLAENLDGALRLGWTRAEHEYGDQYYQRYGLTFLLNYRPGFIR
jgi:hypothetical protein